MRRDVRDANRASMSGEMLAFLCVMAFVAFFLIVPVIFPVGFKAGWDTMWNILLSAFLWALDGLSGRILIIGYLVVGWGILLGAAYLVLNKAYRIVSKIAS